MLERYSVRSDWRAHVLGHSSLKPLAALDVEMHQQMQRCVSDGADDWVDVAGDGGSDRCEVSCSLVGACRIDDARQRVSVGEVDSAAMQVKTQRSE